MRTRNIFGTLLALATMPLLYSCGDDDPEYTPAESLSSVQAYFSSEANSSIELSESETSFDVEIMRANTEGSVSFTLETSGATNMFSIPTTVSFADGSSSATLTIGYDADDFTYGETVEVTLTIPEEYTTPYGISTYTFEAVLPEPWVVYSTGDYTYSLFFTGDDLGLTLYRNAVDPTRWKIEHWGYDVDFLFTYDESTGEVLVDDQYIGYNHSSYGYVYVDDMVDYSGGTSYGSSYYENGVFYFNVIYYVSAGYFGYGYETFVLAGAALSDYSAEVTYNGRYTDASDANYAIANVTLGADVESAKVAMVEGNDISSAVSGIMDGSVESTEIEESGNVTFACETSGTYSFVVVTYGGGEAQESAYVTFKYTVGAAETWTAYAVGDYTYTQFFGSEDEPASDPGLVLYQSDSDPTRWKIEHWGYDVDFYFTYNESTGEVLVDDQETGYTHSSYGMVSVDDMVDYVGSTSYGSSYYENGVFYFNVIYYVSAGYFGYGYETFELTGDASAVSASAVKALNLKSKSCKSPVTTTLQDKKLLKSRTKLAK